MLISIIIQWFRYRIDKWISHWLRYSSIISVNLLQRSQINHIMKSEYVFDTKNQFSRGDSKQRTYACIIASAWIEI